MEWLIVGMLLVPTFGFCKSLEEGQTIGSPNGRYVFGQISSQRRDQYLLDTKTGRLWQVQVNPDGITSLNPFLFGAAEKLYSYTPGLEIKFPVTPIPMANGSQQ